ncbi:MAG: Hsp33 family molecular chaperone HslO [Gammaproteobacteria bacterium]|nr:Hsp33 family molecular chaperone HslO [Gammaproteobacteria bacterium]
MTDNTSFQSDKLQRFIFENAAIRGEWLHLTESWQAVLARRDYPARLQTVLGEMMGAVALLAATVKIKGRVVVQIKSEGPVKLAMVECTSDNTVRAFAQWDEDNAIDDNAKLTDLMAGGTMAITIEVEGAKQPYQGLVSLHEESIAATLETYFQQSEQLATRIWLVADQHHIAGLFLQQLPSEQQNKADEQEHWTRISHLASTITEQELLSLGAGTLLHRLFHEEKCRLFEPSAIAFACNCSRERVAETINLLGQEDATQLLNEQGKIEVACEFCNEHYYFDKIDVAQIFSENSISITESDTIH